ncbi:zinc finger FYVE domain-containing protein 16-like isoform X1 [Rhopilema esculentum]|uniref:zinc finger FYVE domain-containing protein 16-like isoform X1 n=1 Tax=Rhopilema esculentum TaxID=499914 RepID=UPI0031D7EB73
MVDRGEDEFDESLLNQPWDPISYFDEEEGTQEENVQNVSGSDGDSQLSGLFEINLRSVEKDIKRMVIRKQESVDIQNPVFDQKEDAEEPCDTIDRFITYQDNEDHLKAVDNTVLINQRNIDSDMKRFAHFKQNSLQESHENDDITQDPSEGIEDLLELLPDAVQSEPTSQNVTLYEEFDDFNRPSDQYLGNEELDIDAILPDAVTEEPNELREMQPNDNTYDFESIPYNASNILIDLGSKTDENETTNDQKIFDSGDFKMLASGAGSSSGSVDSIENVLQAAEEIVSDFSNKEGSREYSTEYQCNEIQPQDHPENDNKVQHQSNSNDNIVAGTSGLDYQSISETKGDEPDIIQITEKTFVPVDLLENSESGSSRVETLDTSVNSLHDELIRSSPNFDLQEPHFGTPQATSSYLPDTHSCLEGTNVPQRGNQVDQAIASGSSDRRRKKSKKSKQKYLVELVKNDSEDYSSTDSENEMLPERHRDQLSQSLKEQSFKSDLEKHSNIVTEEVENLESVPHDDHKVTDAPFTELPSTEIPENPQTSNNIITSLEPGHQSLEMTENESQKTDLPLPENNELSEEARRISELLADEILNEETNNVSGLQHPVFSPGDGGLHEEADITIDSNEASSSIGNSENPESQLEGATAANFGTRSGSTSDSEELEDFINQQLSDGSAGVSVGVPDAEGDRELPPVPEEIQLGWFAPKWVPDKDAKGCMNCGLKFTVVKRRHHCRACGKVLCSNCCNMKADLAYLGYKSSRVCQACYEILSKAQSLSPLPLMSVSQDVPGRGHTIALNESEPTTPVAADTPPQYMPESPPEYSVLPGSAVQSGPPNPPSYFASSARGSGFRSRTESDRSVVIMFNSSQTDLPPILRIENEVVKIINNPNLKSLFHQMKDKSADPVAFLVNKNLVVKLKVVLLDCCIGKEFWCFSSDGMGASNQEEVVFVVEYKGDDPRLLKCVFQQFNLIFERAKHGEPIADFGYISVDEYMQNNHKYVGMILFKPNVQCVKNLMVPCHPYMFGIWVQESEVPWAKNLPLRLLIRLGAEFKSYPYPFFNHTEREPVFHTVGRTIIGLLADFRSFQYTLPRISGLLVSITKKDTSIKFPQTRYDEVLKVLNTSEENVMAFCGNFNRKADSHLVCVETDGTHSTQTISCRTSNKKLTGCSFVVFSAALKTSPSGMQAKTSIVEDGIMVQVTSDTMKKIRTALKEMQDLVTPAGEAVEGSSEVTKLKISWGASDDSSTRPVYSSRTTSPIDGSPFDGLTNMRIRHSYDFTVSTSPAKIHWQEVYFLPNDGDTVGRLSAKELSQMTSSVAKACMNALSPHLSTLVALEMTKIGLRMILDSDTVEYRIGANKEQMPQELTGDLDDKLIPVIHSVMKTVSHRRVSAELIFQITRIV